jgi:hypothetical protein
MANIELDGVNKKIKVDSGDLTLDVPGDIVLDADGGDVVFADGGTNLLKVTNSSSDVVLQPQVDTKDIVFKQYDGTTVATVEDNATFNIPASKLAIGGTAVTSTAAELNILDGVTATASELNLLDGGTSVGSSITVADADGFVVNDGGTMKTIPATDVATYAGGGGLTLLSSLTGNNVTHANASVDSIFTSTYDIYRIVGFIAPSQDTEARIKLRASGSDISDGDYNWVNMASAVPDSGSTITDQLHSSHGSDFWEFGSADINFDSSGDAVAFDFTLHDPLTNILSRCYMTGHSVFRNGGSAKLYSELFGGGRESNPNADGIKFFTSGGTMNYYRINIFGVKNS